ncbi:SIR2 family NAD-dependent protein deacylase [Clostridium akagii]|uniref:SIR2 family NAD-dependent protein deacylase n=1 Tax=Clostridium akagii TaxID=91623 RepID=UPI00047B90B9|nr:SIR2 family protein [Clostridium akagii]
MCTIEEKLDEMKRILRKTNKQPMFFMGAGLSRRYLESPSWEGLLKLIAKEAKCDYEAIKKACDGENEKIAQELEYYCFRNADIESVETEEHRALFRNYITKIFKEYSDKYNKRYDFGNIEEFNKNIIKRLNDIGGKYYECDSMAIDEQAKRYEEIAYDISVAADIRKKMIEILELKKIHPKAIITTNYDTLIEDFIFMGRCDVQIGQEGFLCGKENMEEDRSNLYKIHGCITKPDTIVITKEDYDGFFNKSKYLYSKILTMFWEYPVIFIGYSISDRNIKDILTVMVDIMTEKQKEEFAKHIWIVDYVVSIKDERVEQKKIELLNGKSISITCFYLNYYYKFYKAVNDVVLSQSFGKLKFNISDNVIELLIKPLYQLQDKMQVVVRELLQNALDACKSKGVSSDISIKLIKDSERNEYLQIEDNGTGMDIKVVRESFLTIGRTSKNKNAKGLVGKYGVGILSLFLLGENAEVYTKTENEILSFRLYIKNEKKQVTWIDKIPDDIMKVDKPSFTIVRVHLKDSIIDEKKTIENYTEKLGLENYLTKSQNSIIIEVNGKKQEIVKLNKDDWFIEAEAGIKIYKADWLEIDYDELSDSDKKLKQILDKQNTVFYNDMISKAIFDVKNLKQLSGIDIPFVALDILNAELYENEIKTSLSRESMNISGSTMRSIGKTIYELEIDEVIKILVNDKKRLNENEIEIFDIIKHLNDKCGIIKKNCDILICNKKISMSEKNMCNHIEVWGDEENFKKVYEKVSYPVKYCQYIMHKALVADYIINGKVKGISIKYLEDYIFNAQSSYYGLKKQALIMIFDSIGISYGDTNISSAALWDFIKTNREEIKTKYDLQAKNEIIWLKTDEELDSILSVRNTYLVVFSKSQVDKYLDDLFSENLHRKIEENNLSEIIQIL